MRVTGGGGGPARPSEQPGFSAAHTRRTLDVVGTRVGINTAQAELVTQGEIAVYDLRGLWMIARIARTTDYLPDLTTEVEVARWLESAGFRAARLAGPADQPIIEGGRVVTFWAQVAEHKHYGTVPELASLLRRLHDLDPPSSLFLPELRPFKGAQARIARAELREDDREFLLSRLGDLRDRYAELDFVLPRGPIHGNASVSSVLPLMWDSRTRVLVDLDCFTVGPREWDLLLTAMYFERFGWHTDDEYLEFASGYGFDVMRWPGYPVLRNIRELILLTWLALNPWSLPEIHAEVSGRIADLRNGNAD
jgi:aminoglycoside phosphotransferase